MKNYKRGEIIIPAGANPWLHEIRVARILAEAGNIVEFIPEGRLKSADIYLNGSMFEIKSPLTNNHKKIIRNVKRALEKSCRVILDTSRMKGISDTGVERLLRSRARGQKTLKRLILVTKNGRIIDIL